MDIVMISVYFRADKRWYLNDICKFLAHKIWISEWDTIFSCSQKIDALTISVYFIARKIWISQLYPYTFLFTKDGYNNDIRIFSCSQKMDILIISVYLLAHKRWISNDISIFSCSQKIDVLMIFVYFIAHKRWISHWYPHLVLAHFFYLNLFCISRFLL